MSDQPRDSFESWPSPCSPDAPREGEAARRPDSSPPPPSGGSVELLHQILARLQRMEGGLSLHEQWLRRIEEEQRQAETTAGSTDAPDHQRLQQLVGSLTLERDRAEENLAEAQRQLGQYQEELIALRDRTASLEAQLADRQQELVSLKSTATCGVEQVRTLQSEAHRQLHLRQQQLQAAQAQLGSAKRQLEERDRRIIELQGIVDEAARRFEAIQSDASLVPAARAWSRFARFAVAMTFLSAFASVGLTGWLFERQRDAAPQTVSTTVMLPGVDAAALRARASKAASEHGVQARADARLGTIELTLPARDVNAAATRLDDVAQAIVADAASAAAGSTRMPAKPPQDRAVAARLADIDRQLASSRLPADQGEAADSRRLAELTDAFKALQAERARIVEKIGVLARDMAASESQPAPADVGPDEITQAESQDPALQSETEAFRQREEQLAGRLRVTIETAALRFEALQQALTEADGQLHKSLEENHPEEVNQQLAIVRESLKTWTQALAGLGSAWKRQRAILDRPGANALTAQAELEKAARAFVGEITPAHAEFNKAIEAIGQGQDQTTKRMVLRNALVKQLAPVTTGQQEVREAARAVVLTDNVELTGIVQRLDALDKQLQQRRTLIAAGLRQERTSELQKLRGARLARLRHEQQGLTKRVAEIDAELLALGEQATFRARENAEYSLLLTRQMALLESKTADLQTLLRMHQAFAAQVADLPALPPPGFLPAKVLASDHHGPRLVSVLLLGAAPILGSAALLALIWLVISTRQSRQAIEEYARTLKETACRASLTESEAASSSGRSVV